MTDDALDPIPHCTVGEANEPARLPEVVREIGTCLRPRLPIHCRAEAVTLLEELADGTWVANRSFGLDGRG